MNSKLPQQSILVSTYLVKNTTGVHIANLQRRPHSFLLHRYTGTLNDVTASVMFSISLRSWYRTTSLHRCSSLAGTGYNLFETVLTSYTLLQDRDFSFSDYCGCNLGRDYISSYCHKRLHNTTQFTVTGTYCYWRLLYTIRCHWYILLLETTLHHTIHCHWYILPLETTIHYTIHCHWYVLLLETTLHYTIHCHGYILLLETTIHYTIHCHWYMLLLETTVHYTVHCHWYSAALTHVPAGSPSHGGDVMVYVTDINQPSLPTPFFFFFF